MTVNRGMLGGLVLLGAVVLGACGNSGASGVTPATASRQTAATTTPLVISSTVPASTVPTIPPTTTTTEPLPPDTVTLKVTGSGTAQTLTILNDTDESQHNGAAIPYSTTITGLIPYVVGISAQTSDVSPSASIGCEIDFTPAGTPDNPSGGPLQVLTTNSSSGPYAVVNCSTDPRTAS
jgi:hypothetical protein